MADAPCRRGGDLEIAVAELRGIMLLTWQIGQVRRGVAMTGFRFHFRLTWIALAAIVGMLSVVSNASASATSGASQNGARACCLKRVCTVCCCPSASASSSPLTAGRSEALLSTEGRFTAPARPCECRSSEPASPASRHDSRSSEDRADQTSGESAQLNVYAPTAVTFARRNLPTASPPKSPLYLRTSRLLI
jgi:hypothetical protein